MNIKIYTDGSAVLYNRTGGWAILVQGFSRKEECYYGCAWRTTNQRMEVTGIIKALSFIALKTADGTNIEHAEIISDSKYALNGTEHWCHGWQKYNFKKKDGKAVINVDLWKQILDLKSKLKTKVTYTWVKGHSGNRGNDLVDVLAGSARQDMVNFNPLEL